MNRIDRLSAILIQLQSKKVVKAQEIADRFSISLRTVYRDVHALEEAGIPLIGEAGMGYSIMDGYKLPPVMFTKEEATAFLMAEKLLEKYTDSYNSNNYKSALYKIKAVLRSTEKDFITGIDDNIMVLKNAGSTQPTHHFIQPILTAISEKKVLSIHYKSAYSDERTERCIEPIGIFLQNTNWYLVAYCRLRKDYRNFKVDRIQQANITSDTFTTNHQPLAKFVERTSKEKELHKVILRIKKEGARFLVTEKFYHGFVSETVTDGMVEMTFLTASLEGMARWFMMFGDHGFIMQPDALKTIVLNITTCIRKHVVRVT